MGYEFNGRHLKATAAVEEVLASERDIGEVLRIAGQLEVGGRPLGDMSDETAAMIASGLRTRAQGVSPVNLFEGI